jgi:GNAT superfamily N-acetyltransferase
MIVIHTYEMDEIVRSRYMLSTARRLTLGYSTSGMNRALDFYESEAPNRHLNARGIFAFNGELAVGWCLLTAEADGMNFSPKDGHSCVQIFVDPKYRRQRIGSRLLTEAKIQGATTIINCYGWSEPDFFNPFMQENKFQSL